MPTRRAYRSPGLRRSMDSDDQLALTIATIRSSLPCSVELPAGAGKTHLIAALAATLAKTDKRSLILTHTNAGVDAIRRKARALDVPYKSATVRTLDAWCFDLVSHYPQLSVLTVPAEPVWEDSAEYQKAAARAIKTSAVQRMLRVSYDMVIVDEYQDCLVDQHSVVMALKAILPTAVFGDRLQGLFNFKDNVPVVWESDVAANFRAHSVPSSPHRWLRTNPQLGEWLLSIREPLLNGKSVSLVGAPVTWREASGPQTRTATCFAQANSTGSVVALGQFRADCAMVARNLSGSYGVMEELEGAELLKFAELIDAGDPPSVAFGTVEFAVKCANGVADKFISATRQRLAAGKSISAPSKPALHGAYDALNLLLTDPTPQKVRDALLRLEKLPGFALYCREAWRDILPALQHAALEPPLTVRNAVTKLRNHTRVVGRRREKRVVSRPLLVKGLEYDHVIILDADRYTAPELYVALTRGSQSVTVISKSQTLTPVVRPAH